MGFEMGKQEQQLSFSFSTLPVLEILHAYTGDGTEMLAAAPGITEIKIKDLKQRLGTLSSILEDIKSIPSEITATFLMLEQRHLSQLATLADEKPLHQDELVDIEESPVGIRAEIIIRHMEYIITQNPNSQIILGEYDEKILLSRLPILKERNDWKNIARIEEILQKITRYSAMKEKYGKACLLK